MEREKEKKFFSKRAAVFLASLLLLVAGVFASTFIVFAQDNNTDDPYGLKESAGVAELGQPLDPSVFVGTLIGSVLAFTGVVFFGLMVYGGMMWLTARGNDQRITKAKDILISASIGIAIVFISYGVTQVIVSQLSTAANIGE